MNYQEYLNQEDPVKLPPGTVTLTREDINSINGPYILDYPKSHKEWEIKLPFKSHVFRYRLEEGSRILITEKDQLSVFRYTGEVIN